MFSNIPQITPGLLRNHIFCSQDAVDRSHIVVTVVVFYSWFFEFNFYVFYLFLLYCNYMIWIIKTLENYWRLPQWNGYTMHEYFFFDLRSPRTSFRSCKPWMKWEMQASQDGPVTVTSTDHMSYRFDKGLIECHCLGKMIDLDGSADVL